MKLGLALGYWTKAPGPELLEAVKTAEALGFDSVWSSESYGSDAFTPLAWYASHTEKIRFGTAIAQISARTPAATAMAAMTMDALTGGRFILGLGVSGPQVVEGWYGQPFAKPLARTREYVKIVREIIARENPVTSGGEHYPLPLPGSKDGKPLKTNLHPYRSDLPIFIAAEGPKNVALSAEIADGWLPFLYSPDNDAHYRTALEEGFAKRDPAIRPREQFEVPVSVPVVPGANFTEAADRIRPMFALYIGGMGSKETNFHKDQVVALGYGEIADKIQDAYLAGHKEEAAKLVPDDLIDQVAIVGTPEHMSTRLPKWQQSLATTIVLQADARGLQAIAAGLRPFLNG